MRTVFFGTPEWAVASLETLLRSPIEVAAVVTNPDRAAGRGMESQAPPVKVTALNHGLDVLQPASARDPQFHETLAALAPDVAIVVAYGKILPPSLLDIPAHGFVNLHFSLLPEYRGAAPVQRAIIDGKNETGVSIIVLTEGIDEGPVLAMQETPILEEDTSGTLGRRLAELGAPLLVDTLDAYVHGRIEPREQDHDRATYAPKVTEDDARVSWQRSAREIVDLVRGLDPAPGAWTTLGGKRLKLWRLRPLAEANLAPGRVVFDRALIAGTGSGDVVIEEAQMEGKRRMSGADLGRGLRLGGGENFE